MISDSESAALTRQSSSALLGAGLVLLGVGAALVVLWLVVGGHPQLLLVLSVVADLVGVLLVAAAVVRLAEKFEDVHRMLAAHHQARVRDDIRQLRERS